MPKKQRTVVPHTMTRGQMSRHQRELQRQRYLYLAMGAVLGFVVLVFGVTAANELVIKPMQANEKLQAVVATVGDQKLTRATYNKVRSWNIYNQIRYQEILSQQGASSGSTNTAAQIATLQQQLQNVANEDANALDQSTIQTIADNSLVVQRAGTITVTVDDNAVRAEALKNFEPVPTPIPQPTVPPATSTATPATPPPTPTNTPATPVPTATYTPTETETPGPSPTPTSTPTITQTPIPVPGAQLTATVDYNNFISSVKNGPKPDATNGYCVDGCPGLTEPDYLELIVKPSLVQRLVTEKLQTQVPTTAEQVHAAHILFQVKTDTNTAGTHTEAEARALAEQTLARLQKGEDFATLAKQLSEDTSNKDKGGDLGWFLPSEQGGPMVQPFSDAAFKLTKPGDLSPVVTTQFGFHIIKLIERGQHPLSSTDLQSAKDKAYQNWLDAQKKAVPYPTNLLPTAVPTPTAVTFPPPPTLPPVTNPPITGTNPLTNTGTITSTPPLSGTTAPSSASPPPTTGALTGTVSLTNTGTITNPTH